jgi:hypothetical protein
MPDFSLLTTAQIRTYLLEHRGDEQAFQALMQRLENAPNKITYLPGEGERMIRDLEERLGRSQETGA